MWCDTALTIITVLCETITKYTEFQQNKMHELKNNSPFHYNWQCYIFDFKTPCSNVSACTMTAANNDDQKPWQWRPQGRQWRQQQQRPQTMTATNQDNDSHRVDKGSHIVMTVIFVAITAVVCGLHCCGRQILWPSLCGRHCQCDFDSRVLSLRHPIHNQTLQHHSVSCPRSILCMVSL